MVELTFEEAKALFPIRYFVSVDDHSFINELGRPANAIFRIQETFNIFGLNEKDLMEFQARQTAFMQKRAFDYRLKQTSKMGLMWPFTKWFKYYVIEDINSAVFNAFDDIIVHNKLVTVDRITQLGMKIFVSVNSKSLITRGTELAIFSSNYSTIGFEGIHKIMDVKCADEGKFDDSMTIIPQVRLSNCKEYSTHYAIPSEIRDIMEENDIPYLTYSEPGLYNGNWSVAILPEHIELFKSKMLNLAKQKIGA